MGTKKLEFGRLGQKAPLEKWARACLSSTKATAKCQMPELWCCVSLSQGRASERTPALPSMLGASASGKATYVYFPSVTYAPTLPNTAALPPTEAINSSIVVSGAQIKGDKQVPRNHEPYQNQRNSTRSGSLAHGRGLRIEVSPTRHFSDRCEPGYYGAVLLGSPDRKGCHPLCKNLKKKEESLLVSLVFTDASVTSNLGYLVATHFSLTGHQSPWSLRLSVCVWCGKRFQRQDGQVPSAMMVLRQKS